MLSPHREKILLLSPHRQKKNMIMVYLTQLINGIFLIRHMGGEVQCKKWRRKKQNIDFQVLYYDVKMTLEYLTFYCLIKQFISSDILITFLKSNVEFKRLHVQEPVLIVFWTKKSSLSKRVASTLLSVISQKLIPNHIGNYT